MKKIVICALALIVSANAFAGFGMPKVNAVNTGNSTIDSKANAAVNKGIEKGKNMAVAEVINNKLQKYHCSFKKDDMLTVDKKQMTCDLDKIAGEIAAWKGTLESTIVNKVKVNVMASHKTNNSGQAGTRAMNICNKISEKVNWWDCNKSTSSGSNDFTVSVSVN